MILDRFYPDDYVDSVYGIDFRKLHRQGYRGVLFDIDNTLVPHGADATPQAVAFFRTLREIGFETCLISNNKEPRVRRFNREIESYCISNAHKPSRTNYRKAMQLMGTDAEHTLFVGDQLFTDVYGAKRTGIYSILVRPIHSKEEIQIVIKRYLERIVLHFYLKSRNDNSRGDKIGNQRHRKRGNENG